MSTSVELRQQRARVVDSMRALIEAAETDNRDLTGEEQQTYARQETEFRELTGRIERTEFIEQRDAERAQPINPANPGAQQPDADTQKRARRDAFVAWMRRCMAQLNAQTRALVENTAGEILVPEDLEAELYRTTPQLVVLRQLASRRTTGSDRVRRRSLDEVKVGWGKLETGTPLTDSMPSTPGEDWTYVEDLYGLAKIGEDELMDTDANLEAFVMDSFARAIAETEEVAFAVGTGHAAKQPIGLFDPQGGVQTVTGSSATYAAADAVKLVDDLKKLYYAVPAFYRRGGAYLMSSATELIIATAKASTGEYLWQPSVQAGRPNSFAGFAVYNVEAIPAPAANKKIAAFGDLNAAYRIYDRIGVTMQRLNELYAEAGMVGFKVHVRVGGDVVRPDAVRILTTAAS